MTPKAQKKENISFHSNVPRVRISWPLLLTQHDSEQNPIAMRTTRRFRSTKHGLRRLLQRLLSAALAGREESPRPRPSAAHAHEAKGVGVRRQAWQEEDPIKVGKEVGKCDLCGG